MYHSEYHSMVYHWTNDIPLAIILPNTIERPLIGIPFRIPFNGIPFNGIPLAIILPNTIERPLTDITFIIPFNGIPFNE